MDKNHKVVDRGNPGTNVLKKITIKQSYWKGIPKQEKYCLLLLGQIFNESMMLHKLWAASIPTTSELDRLTPQEIAMVAQAQLLDRILAGKIYESIKKIRTPLINEFLSEKCFIHMEPNQGLSLLKELNRKFSGCKWISSARNKHSMHFPDFETWERALDYLDQKKQRYEYFAGFRTAESFYKTSAEAAVAAYYIEAGCQDTRNEVAAHRGELLDISSRLHELVGKSLNAYLLYLRKPGNEHISIKDTIKFEWPKYSELTIPYFVLYDKAKR